MNVTSYIHWKMGVGFDITEEERKTLQALEYVDNYQNPQLDNIETIKLTDLSVLVTHAGMKVRNYEDITAQEYIALALADAAASHGARMPQESLESTPRAKGPSKPELDDETLQAGEYRDAYTRNHKLISHYNPLREEWGDWHEPSPNCGACGQ